MTAPIVWHDDRTPLSTTQITLLGPEIGSTRVRASHAGHECAGFESIPTPAGQLWDRLAERAEGAS